MATQPLARAVEGRLGRSVFVSAAQADVSVEGRIERRGKGFRATLVLRDARGEELGTREISRDDPSCEALTEPLALVIAVMIDPDASPGTPPAPEPAPPAPPPAPRVIVQTRTERVYVPVPVPVEKPSWHLIADIALSGRLGFGLVPEVGPGLSASGLIIPLRYLGFEGRAAILLPVSAEVQGGAQISFTHGVLGGGLCPFPVTLGRVLLSGCGLSDLGILIARPTGLPRAVNETRITLAGGVGARASILLAAPLTVRLGVDAMVPLLRESFVITGPAGDEIEVFRQSPITVAVDVGLGVSFR